MEKVDLFECPRCDCLYLDKEDAVNCCSLTIGVTKGYACPVCGCGYNNEKGALECCKSEDLK